LLREDLLVHTAELILDAMHLIPRCFALLAIQFHGRGAGQAPLNAAHYSGHHLQVS
jgi:hypothetical protein